MNKIKTIILLLFSVLAFCQMSDYRHKDIYGVYKFDAEVFDRAIDPVIEKMKTEYERTNQKAYPIFSSAILNISKSLCL